MVAADVTSVEEIVEEISMLQEYMDLYLPKIISFGIRVLLALLVFFIGTKVIKFLRKVIRRSLDRAGAELGAIQFLDSILKIALYFILIMFLDTFLIYYELFLYHTYHKKVGIISSI